MTPSNFNWFLHTMLFYHTRYVLERQKYKSSNNAGDDSSDEEDDQGVDDNEEKDDNGDM